SLNDTYLPDADLRTFTPVFLIRHPAVAFPSFLRIDHNLDAGEVLPKRDPEAQKRWISLFMTTRWSRRLAEWFSTQNESGLTGTSGDAGEKDVGNGETEETWPIILDADDLIASGPVILPKLAARLDLDASKFL